jgi:8-oxo-dGTP diphosphatase
LEGFFIARACLSAGGVYFVDDTVLLVQVSYGANKGKWMLPGGHVEDGESLEEAAIREFKEETGLDVTTGSVLCFRSATQEIEEGIVTSLYVVYEILCKGGVLVLDGEEISNLSYWKVEEVMESPDVIDLTKEIVSSSYVSTGGLAPGQNITTNNKYSTYQYYISQNL